tara:strand:- start:969 stop:1409 length:441 start_codon:yes stop_codon:yes gene_type:complete
MIMHKIFISGPMTGYEDYNRPAFFHMEDVLTKAGWDVANPANNGVHENQPFYVHLKADFKMLLKCDAIFSLNGWKDSPGATMEYLVARNCGMPQIFRRIGVPAGVPEAYDYEYNIELLNSTQPIPRPVYNIDMPAIVERQDRELLR